MPAASLRVGDLFAVRPGEKVATDGVVVEGTSALDTSLLTGEPVPVDVGPGDAVTGATVNTSGYLVVRATRVGEETTLSQIGRLVTQAQTGKAPVQRLADRISAVFVPVVISLAVLTFVGWLISGAGAAGGVHRRRRGDDHRLPVRARASPRRPRCWSAPGAAPSSACSSRARRSSSRPAGWTRWCWTRPAPSPRAACR